MLFLLVTSAFLLAIVALIHNGMSAAFSTSIFTHRLSRIVFKLTTIIGTPIHELSHAIACVLFGHKITGIKLLDLSFSNTTLGYVNHSWNTRSVYQSIGCFFIAIAPLFTASAIVYFAFVHNQWPRTIHYPNNIDIQQAIWIVLSNAVSQVVDWILASTQNIGSSGKLIIVSLICFHCIPSKTDFHNAAKGSMIVAIVTIALFTLGLLAKDLGFNVLLRQYHFIDLLNVLTLTASVMFLAQLFWLMLALIAKLSP